MDSGDDARNNNRPDNAGIQRFDPAIIASPLPAVGSAEKSTPKKWPQVIPIALMK
jgi:hypothetical protein